MKLYLDRLTDQEKLKFEDEVLSEIKIDYPVQTRARYFSLLEDYS
jgi:trans-aconitate methyltransferase